MRNVRKAIEAARELYGSDQPLTLFKFQTDGRELFTHELEPSRYVNLTRRGQIAWEHIRDVLKDLEYDESGVAFRWWPSGKDKPIVIDPRISFGRPYLIRRGISTDAIFGRFVSGESIESILDDFELTGAEVEAAVRFESRAAAA